MSPSHFRCWDSYGPLCTKPYSSRSFAEIISNTPQERASPRWGLGWKLDTTAPFFKSQLLIFHFQEGSATAVTFILFYFILISIFFTKFVVERDRSPSGTLDSGCTGVLLPLAAALCQDKAVRRLHLVRAEGNTMPNSFHT